MQPTGMYELVSSKEVQDAPHTQELQRFQRHLFQTLKTAHLVDAPQVLCMLPCADVVCERLIVGDDDELEVLLVLA